MGAGDTFRAAASDQLEIWAERTGCEIVVAEKEKVKASSGKGLNIKNWNVAWSHLRFSALPNYQLKS